ncbi:MAG: chromosome segregation protein SMC [Opitutae bacterium]|nr:chromosome segregation protein SMC [Opitutae bacterium]
MYLKALEMVGFKSFAERTKLVFEPGMMAIVGPNGCGKSNVSDAIRWVLGEQSPKALRGGAMTDVIFNGTDHAKPLAMAEVSLTLTDCEAVLGTEYNEVTVTRRVFRSGEGQYFINKAPCRLKDIQRLFMDTGLGTNSYSVMEQGRIDQILSSRPDDRREVFEEASGISKYKADKKEALRKLEHTEANLLRLSDIIKEVKRQIISLQRQVGKAKRYKSLQDQLRASDVWLGKSRLAELDDSLAALEAELKTHAAREETLRAGVEASESSANELRQNMAEVEGRIAAAMDASAEASGALARARELIRVNHERAQELESLSQRDSRETESARAGLEGHQAALDALKKDLIAATDAHETARAELERRQAALAAHDQETAAARKRLQELRTEALDLETRLARLQNEWNEIEARERTDLIRRERFAAEKGEAERAVESYEERLGLMATQRGQKQAGAEQAQRQVEDLRQTQTDRAEQLAALQRETSALASAAAAREAQVNLLAKSRAEARGFPAGAKKLLEAAPVPGVNPQDILGSLAEKVRADKAHKLALEAVLRSWLDAVLVKDAASALEIAKQLQAAKGGAVRLLAAAGGEGGAASEGPGEPLLDHVKAPAELAPLLRRLMGAVRVVASAAEVPGEIPASLTYVTRDGIVARGDGSVEFWAPGENESNPLAREHQLAEWQEDLERLRQSLGEKRVRAEALQQDETAGREALNAAQTSLESHRREMALAEGEIRMVEREAKQARERAETIGWELEALVQKTGAGTQRRTAMAGEMEGIRARQADVRAQNAADAEKVHQLEDQRNALLEEATECRVALSGYKQQLDGLRARGEPLEARIRELETLIRERAAGINSYQERLAALAQATQAAEGQIAPLEAELERRQAELHETRALRESRNAELARSDAALHASRAELDATREQRNGVDIQLARQRLHRQNLVERMSAEYSLQPADVLKAKEPEWEEGVSVSDRETLETLVAELRTKIQSMGPVNLVAIEEHQELEERFAFLSQQNDDLVNAKQQLMDLIRKINETTTSLFTATFNQVNENFQELFKQLFGGGNAKLVLVDEENVLESGIEIIARPPGKKLQTVSLLSGGERTLTAVALLFSLFKVKPSAFCLTDELDAALDDANIGRYLEMLKIFVQGTQFIIITHNRQTIGAAAALYGVTMEKQGISKIVSVKFSDAAEPAKNPA